MRKWLLLAGMLAIGGLPVQGLAAPLAFLDSSSLSQQIATLPPVAVSAAGTAEVTGPVTMTLPSGIFGTQQVIPVTDPGAFPIVGVDITVMNGVGNFSGGSGIMPVSGNAKVCLFGASCASAAGNITVPLSNVGAGGTTTVTGAVNVTVIGAGWTTGTATVFDGTTVLGTAMGGTTNGGTGGSVTWVTPVTIMTNIGASAVLPSFARLHLQFVPEPGATVMMIVGAGVLALAGRRRLQ